MEQLRQLQLKELEMLKLFANFCEENHLRYFLLGGTLLGAVRHKGFIPWDDDVDVAMPRSDYNRFLELSRETFRSPLSVNLFDRTPNYHYSFARLSDSTMHVINHSANRPRKEEISIDIIPMDGFPDPGFKRKIHKLHLSFWWNLNQIVLYDELVNKSRKRSRKESVFVFLAGAFKWIGKIIKPETCLNHLNCVLSKYDYDSDTVDIINYLAAIGFKEVFPRKSFGAGAAYVFEDGSFIGPQDYDTVCKIIYGNYMELPPENERNWHNTEVVDE